MDKGVGNVGYRIEYDSTGAKMRRIGLSKEKRRVILIVGVLIITVLIMAFPAGRLWIRDLLLPGNEAVTAAALEDFAEDIRQGQSFGQAVEAFCREIIHGS